MNVSKPRTPAQEFALKQRNSDGTFKSFQRPTSTQSLKAPVAAGADEASPEVPLGALNYEPTKSKDNPQARAAWVKSRAELLRKSAYVPAVTQVAQTRAERRQGIDKWWAQAHAGGTYGGPKVHRMPDDYTPKGSLGNAVTGNRRTHRMLYTGGKYAIRMPSKTAVNRFAKEVGSDIFEFPAQIETKGGRSLMVNVQAWRQSNGEFVTKIVGHQNPDAKGYAKENFNEMAEAVGAILEGRRPSVALTTRKLTQRAKSRAERAQYRADHAGVAIEESSVKAAGVEGFGADRRDSLVYTKFRKPDADGKKRVYIHRSTVASAIKDILASKNPTTIFNKEIKDKGVPLGRAAECGACGRYYPQDTDHVCPEEYTRGKVKRTDHFERAKRQFAVKNIAKALGVRPGQSTKKAST